MHHTFKLNRKQILSGFWKGMAGVAALYSPASMPEPAEIKITPLRTPISEPMEALRSDWVAIGRDIDAAVQSYGQIAQK